MTKKDYIAVAGIIHSQVDSLSYQGDEEWDIPADPEFFPNGEAFDAVKAVAEGLANLFQSENPRFSRTQFLDACGVS